MAVPAVYLVERLGIYIKQRMSQSLVGRQKKVKASQSDTINACRAALVNREEPFRFWIHKLVTISCSVSSHAHLSVLSLG